MCGPSKQHVTIYNGNPVVGSIGVPDLMNSLASLHTWAYPAPGVSGLYHGRILPDLSLTILCAPSESRDRSVLLLFCANALNIIEPATSSKNVFFIVS